MRCSPIIGFHGRSSRDIKAIPLDGKGFFHVGAAWRPVGSPSRVREVIELVQEALRGLGLEPSFIPPGRVDDIRGGIASFELKAGGGIDAAVILTRLNYGLYRTEGDKNMLRVDYAVRGSIRGVLPGRILARTQAKARGLLRREITDFRWEVPQERRGEVGLYPPEEAVPPGPGELWDGCPHEALAESLNGDDELGASMRSLLQERRGSLTIMVFSDRWGETIRIGGNLWLEPRALPALYLGAAYVRAMDRIGMHIREVRRRFGGLAF
jgi:hypothetical protein